MVGTWFANYAARFGAMSPKYAHTFGLTIVPFFYPALSGRFSFWGIIVPRALPWAILQRPFRPIFPPVAIIVRNPTGLFPFNQKILFGYQKF